MTGRASVVLAGPNQLLLIGVKQVLEATDRFKVVSQAHASELALTLARQLRPDYVVLDETKQSHETNAGAAGVIDTLRGLVQLPKPPGVLVVLAPDQFRLVEELRTRGMPGVRVHPLRRRRGRGHEHAVGGTGLLSGVEELWTPGTRAWQLRPEPPAQGSQPERGPDTGSHGARPPLEGDRREARPGGGHRQ